MSALNRPGAIAVPPIAITPAMIVSCDVPETDYPEYAAGTTYADGVRAIVAAEHKVYQSVAAGNVGNTPSTSPDKWRLVGSTNKYKCLNYLSLATKTVKTGGFSYRIKPGQVVNAVVLDAAVCDAVRVRVIDPVAGTVYDTRDPVTGADISMLGRLRFTSHYEWYFGRRKRKPQLLLLDLPAYYAADIVIDVIAAGEASLGLLMLGYQIPLGFGTKLGLRSGITDYSKDIVNEFGDTIFTRLAYSDRCSMDLYIDNSEVDEVRENLANLRATPAMYIGSDLYRLSAVFGRYSDFEVLLEYNTQSVCSLNLKGLPRD